MRSGLKSRIKRLEDEGIAKVVPGIIIYFENEVREEVDGVSHMVSADYYLVNSNDGEPMTNEELEKALKDKTYISYMPIEDTKVKYVEVSANENVQ